MSFLGQMLPCPRVVLVDEPYQCGCPSLVSQPARGHALFLLCVCDHLGSHPRPYIRRVFLYSLQRRPLCFLLCREHVAQSRDWAMQFHTKPQKITPPIFASFSFRFLPQKQKRETPNFFAFACFLSCNRAPLFRPLRPRPTRTRPSSTPRARRAAGAPRARGCGR